MKARLAVRQASHSPNKFLSETIRSIQSLIFSPNSPHFSDDIIIILKKTSNVREYHAQNVSINGDIKNSRRNIVFLAKYLEHFSLIGIPLNEFFSSLLDCRQHNWTLNFPIIRLR